MEKKERNQKKGRRPGASAKEISDDQARCGVAMAARAGEVWEGGTADGRQGCPACCSHARGWRWADDVDGSPTWRAGVSGVTAVRADLAHVLCGNCEGVSEETRRVEKGELRSALQRLWKTVTRKGRRGAPPTIDGGRHSLVKLFDAAQRALAKGARATGAEREALRAVLAGDLPRVGGQDEGKLKGLAQEVAGTVRRAQEAAARLRATWLDAGGQKMARRREREGYAAGRMWKAVAIETWAERVQAKRVHEAMGGEQGQRGGWTTVHALKQYKKRQQRLREEKEARARSTPGAAQHGTAAVVVRIAATATGTGTGTPTEMAMGVALHGSRTRGRRKRHEP